MKNETHHHNIPPHSRDRDLDHYEGVWGMTKEQMVKFVSLSNEEAFPSVRNLGISKREYFAAMILQGLLAGGSNIHAHGENAANACNQADALIAELNKESK